MARRDGRDKLEERGDRWAEDAAERPGRFVLKITVMLAAFVLFASVVFGAVSWISSWGGEAARITGPDNSREQFTAIIGAYNELQATAGNICDARAGAGGEGDPTLVERPDFAYRATYRRIAADYNRRMDNAFEAGIVRRYPGLRDYPRDAPALRDALADAGC